MADTTHYATENIDNKYTEDKDEEKNNSIDGEHTGTENNLGQNEMDSKMKADPSEAEKEKHFVESQDVKDDSEQKIEDDAKSTGAEKDTEEEMEKNKSDSANTEIQDVGPADDKEVEENKPIQEELQSDDKGDEKREETSISEGKDINAEPEEKGMTKSEDATEEVKEKTNEANDVGKDAKSDVPTTPDVMDVFGNGDLTKERLKSGTGAHTRPNQGEIGIVNVKTMLPDGTVIDERKNYRFTVGQLEAVQAVDLAVMLMEIGEVAKITTVSKFTTPRLDFNPKVPEGTEKLIYEIELVDVDPIPNYSIMKSEELQPVLIRKKELGNFLMLRNDYAMALTSYNHAKEIFYQATNEIDTSIKVAIWNNMAACYLKMENYTSVVEHTDKVLALQPENIKALFRKGKALGMQGNFQDSLAVLNKGIKIAQDKDLKLFHQAAADIRTRMNKANSKERAMYKAMFDPDSKSKDKKKKTSGVSWFAVGALAAVVVAVGAALIKVNLSSS